jgi:hypothetical protein
LEDASHVREEALMDIQPRFTATGLTGHVRRAASAQAIMLPKGLALLYWDHDGVCWAFSLLHNNLHFGVESLNGVHAHVSEIIPV